MNIRGRWRSIAFQKDLRLSSWRMAYPSFIVFRATSRWNYRVCRPPQLAASFITSHASNVAYWHQQTCQGDLTMSALEGRTDVPCKRGHFRFGPEGDISYRPRNDSSIFPRIPRSCWNRRWRVELRRPLLNLALLGALECGSLVRRWKQTIEGTATRQRLSRGTTPHEREHPRRKGRF